MSFSFQFTAANKAEARAKVDELPDNVPGSIRVYVKEGLDPLPDDKAVEVSGYGHLHNGEEGNYPVTSATVAVTPK